MINRSSNSTKYHLAIVLMIAAIYVFLFSGYNFYSQDEHMYQLPGVLHFFDSQLYSTDLKMQTLSHLWVKNIPHVVLFMIAGFTSIPVQFLYFGFYILVVYSIFILVYKITLKLSGEWFAGLLACFLLILLSENKYLKSSLLALINGALTSRLIAMALYLLCFFLVLRGKLFLSVFVAGLLFPLHEQDSAYTILSILVVVAFLKKDARYLLKYLTIYTLIITPVLIPIIVKFHPFAQLPGDLKEFVLFRQPHHTFPDPTHLVIMLFLSCSLVLMCHMKTKSKYITKEIIYWVSPLIFVYFVGIISTKYFPIDLLILLMYLRVDLFLRMFYFILFSIRFLEFSRCVFKGQASVEYDLFWKIFMTSQGMFVLAIFLCDPLKISTPRIEPVQNKYIDIAVYARDHTPKNSLFITPPHLPGFRLYAQRSIVVDFKNAAPIYLGSGMQDEWMRRLKDICNVSCFEARGFKIAKECIAGFRSLTLKQMRSLCDKYHADYFVTYSDINNQGWEDLSVCKNEKFSLMRCPGRGSSPEVQKQ